MEMMDVEGEEAQVTDEGSDEDSRAGEPVTKELERIWGWLLEEAGSAAGRGDENGEALATRFLQLIQASWLFFDKDTEEFVPRPNT
eukprot:1030808-Heterocapsa_arctica.AAC.1